MNKFLLCLLLFCATNFVCMAQTMSGTASFYAQKFNGRRMANGGTFSNSGSTCACNRLPLGTRVLVTNIKNGKTVELTVTDRLAANNKRVVDVTAAAAKTLGFYSAGLTKVTVEVLGRKKKEEMVNDVLPAIDSAGFDVRDTAMLVPKRIRQ
jgi:rare lipoprotein A